MTTVSVVTGGAGAMGSACALALAPSVDVVLLCDVDAERLAEMAEGMRPATTASIRTAAGDLGRPDDIDALVAQAGDLGEFHSLVHTAGLSPSMAGWREILTVDLVASARLLDAFEPLVTAGSVAVCLASVSGHMGAFDPAVDALLDEPYAADLESRFQALAGHEPESGATYRLAKRGVVRRCERAAVSWGARGGRVVSVSPGLIDTDMGRLELVNNPIKTWLAEQTPVGGDRTGADTVLPGLTSDIAEMVAFLCSARAAFVSGCDIRVDGGLVGALNAQS